MRRLPAGASLPVRNLPSSVVQKEVEKEPPKYYLEWVNSRLLQTMNTIARHYADLSRTVEEYQGDSFETATGEVALSVVPDFEPAPEVITEVLVTGPPNAPFILQLGDRYMTLVTDATGKVLLSPVFIKLKATSQRKLTVGNVTIVTPSVQDGNSGNIVAATAGSVTLPNATDSMAGFAISLSTVGTAAMTVIVSNVQGGPYVFTIPVGGQSLIVNFPVPLRTTGGIPQVAWNATAAAVGNVSVFGLTQATSGLFLPTPGSWMLHMSGYAQTRNET